MRIPWLLIGTATLLWAAQCFTAAGVAADTLVHYYPDETDQTDGVIADADPLTADTLGARVQAGDLVQSAPAGYFNTLVWPVSADGPFDLMNYIAFTIAPDEHMALGLDALIYSGFSYGASDLTLHLRSSLDGFAADIGAFDSSGDGFREFEFHFDLSALPREITIPVEFHLYPDNRGGAADFLDLAGGAGAGLKLEGESLPPLRDFVDAQFYSFSEDRVGGFEIPDGDRHIRFLALDPESLRLQNQFSGDARAYCIDGYKEFLDLRAFNGGMVTAQFPACLDLSASDLPSDVIVWRLPDGALYKFQMMAFTIDQPIPEIPDILTASGSFRALPIEDSRLDFGDANFYSFSLNRVGGFELPDVERHIRFLALDADTLQLQNQYTGNARLACLAGNKDFEGLHRFNPAQVTSQFPACINIDLADLPSDISVWRLPNGDLFKFQMLSASIEELFPASDIYTVSGRFQTHPLRPSDEVFGSGFE